MDNPTKKEIFLKKGKVRGRVLDILNKPKTATEIAKELGLHRSSVSRVLLMLEKKGFVRCINKDDSSFRHYKKR